MALCRCSTARRSTRETCICEDPGYDLVEYGAAIRPAIAELSEHERLIVGMRFFQDLTQSEIARRVGVSQMQVSRVLRRAVEHLHKATRAAA